MSAWLLWVGPPDLCRWINLHCLPGFLSPSVPGGQYEASGFHSGHLGRRRENAEHYTRIGMRGAETLQFRKLQYVLLRKILKKDDRGEISGWKMGKCSKSIWGQNRHVTVCNKPVYDSGQCWPFSGSGELKSSLSCVHIDRPDQP